MDHNKPGPNASDSKSGARQPATSAAVRDEIIPDTHHGLGVQNVLFAEDLYAGYLADPGSVPADWRRYFEQFPQPTPRAARTPFGPSFRRGTVFNPPSNLDGRPPAYGSKLDVAVLQERIDRLIRNYRVRGHTFAAIDPLQQPRPALPELDPSYYGLSESDLDLPVSTHEVQGPDVRTVRATIESLRETYCRSIGVQFMHIDELAVREWLQSRMEGSRNRLKLTRSEQLRILTRLTDAVVFEEFIQKKFIGAKSFSLEGAESLIPLLDLAIEKAGEDGINEIVLGMAHRGRLNVLANIMGKSASRIFREFEDVDSEIPRGDVKYHLGYSADWKAACGRKVHLSLCFNPSHLEFVNGVTLGRMRAKQDRFGDVDGQQGLALLIHGDAAFAGEGTVQETLNMSELAGYSTGGTIHVVVNNQIGFTTPAAAGRSSTYATDVAKMLQIPIFHVNGEAPEAVAQVVRLALDFRKTFHRDVVIDMYCYRRRGHNEGDEPAFTQPLMYRAIEQIKPVREGYLNQLLELGDITREEADRISDECRNHLAQELALARSDEYVHHAEVPAGLWAGYYCGPYSKAEPVETDLAESRLADLLEVQTRLPEGFHPHPKIERLLAQRLEMARGERPLDWAAAEAVALASLAVRGVRVRLSGQDCERGTFSQRHAVLHDVVDDHTYVPLEQIAPNQAAVTILNSPLSEAGVLGFEYGYSLDTPDGLVMWEAQFGDFANAAQVIIDQFIVCAEYKWHRLTGLVLLLPHGFEGQGPEHSSARLERFLTLAAEDNIQVVQPTTPAQYFHCLRRQGLWRWKKPLVMMTPKSLLRHPAAVSTLGECARGRFQTVLPDPRDLSARRIKRLLLCTGKVYFDLEKARQDQKRDDVAIVRIEQLYPFPVDDLRTALAPYPAGMPAFWVQEEPENMGAWRFLRCLTGEKLVDRFPLSGIYRPAAASPATGSKKIHDLQQERLIAEAFDKKN